ncbi:restriction endonuclease [[Clostridium] innocuum]|nr:restriction endonuclease [[Clostridium] innocuum]
MAEGTIKKKTIAQKNANTFESLAYEIVSQFFKDTNAQICKTGYSKDGGYDIIVSLQENDITQKIYFECKLRSGNLQLRDISANLIIAFNEGAAALGIITNYDYTYQTREHVSSFFENTALNIKIIIGTDIQELANRYNLHIPDELSNIISCKKTVNKKEYQFLRIDMTTDHIYKQFLAKGREIEASDPFIVEVNQEKKEKLIRHIQNGDTICLTGLPGVGKTSFIDAVLALMPHRKIHVVADEFTSRKQLLLSLYLNICGISQHSIINDFDDNIIDRIIAAIDKKTANENIGRIVRSFFHEEEAKGIENELYNSFICKYLIDLLMLHRPFLTYCFFIEKAGNATEEVQPLLAYLCKLLHKNNISCIIEKQDSEYLITQIETSNYFFERLDTLSYFQIEIELFTKSQARKFIQQELNGYPSNLCDRVLDKGGVRLLTLKVLTEFTKKSWEQHKDVTRLIAGLHMFTANDLPASILSYMHLLYQQCPMIFHYLYFFEGRIPYDFVINDSFIHENIINDLMQVNFLIMDGECLTTANILVKNKIKEYSNHYKYNTRKAAISLEEQLQVISDPACMRIETIICKINVLTYFQKNAEVLPLLNFYMHKLWKERQYTLFLRYIDRAYTVIDEKDNQSILKLTISALNTWVIKKQSNASEADHLFLRFEITLQRLKNKEKAFYQMVYDYFLSKRYFKNCSFKDSLKITEKYYLSYIRGEIKDEEQWIDRICIVFALSVKELEGNEAALKIFQELMIKNEDSFYFKWEYLSHRQCMNFYENPKESLHDINLILKMFKDVNSNTYPLPYHEYVDKAVSAFCAKEYENTVIYANDAITILESNGIIPSLGRAYNVRGCAQVCLGDIASAEASLKEACFIMDETRYDLFGWRGSLNLIQLEVYYPSKDFTIAALQQLLNKTYQKFYNIYADKLAVISKKEDFIKTREYFALLMFGHLSKLLKINLTENILHTLLPDRYAEFYLMQLKQMNDKRIKHTAFSNTPYSLGKYIFMVG